jgi:hypothetical protein
LGGFLSGGFCPVPMFYTIYTINSAYIHLSRGFWLAHNILSSRGDNAVDDTVILVQVKFFLIHTYIQYCQLHLIKYRMIEYSGLSFKTPNHFLIKISISVILNRDLYLLQDGRGMSWKSCFINCIISPWWKYVMG